MATTELEEQLEANEADEIVLEPKLGPRWALAPIHLAVMVVFCVLFMVFNYMPLRGTDLWGHAAYGRWILEHGTLPDQDPFLPLAEGMRVVDSAWLSQVLFAAVERLGGAEALSSLFALTTLATLIVLARVLWLRSQRIPVMMAGVACVLVIGWSRLGTIRPENFGWLAFALLLWLFAGDERDEAAGEEGALPARPRWVPWVGVPLVMTLWANLHGSFVCGLLLLGCMFAGRFVEVFSQTGDFHKTIADRLLRRRLYLLELGTVATLLNPYGVDLLLYTLWFANNENLKDILEWQPLVILGVGGREFALSWVLLLVALRHSRRRVRPTDVLILGLFAIAAVTGIRMMSWYASAFAYVIAPHLADMWNRFASPRWRDLEPPPVLDESSHEGFTIRTGRTWNYSLIGMLLIWITFALAPIGRPVVGDEPRDPQLLLDKHTPRALSAYLRENPPEGQIYNPQWWGDWLVWDGPERLQPFMTTNMHLAPREMWRDYRHISAGEAGWQRALDRYDVRAMVVDKQRQPRLARSARRSADWRTVYEDELGLVLERRLRSPASEKQSEAAEKEQS